MKIIKKLGIILVLVFGVFFGCKEPNDPTPIDENPKNDIVVDFSEVEEYLYATYDNLEISSDISLPLELEIYKAKLVWEYNSIYLNNGKFIAPTIDTDLNVLIKISIEEEIKEISVNFILKGKEEVVDNPVTPEVNFSDIEKYLIDNYEGLVISSDIEFPTYLEEFDCELIWESGEDTYLTNEGKFTAPILDLENDLFVIIILNGKEKEIDIEVTLKGWGRKIDAIEAWVRSQVPSEIKNSIRLPKNHPVYGCEITWVSPNEAAITSEGYITKDPNNDVSVTLEFSIKYEGEERNASLSVVVLKMTDTEKNSTVKDWLDSLFLGKEEIDSDIELPKTDLKYNANITWKSNSPGIVSETGKYNIPIFDRVVSLVATSNIGTSNISITYTFNVYGKPINDIWEGVEKLLSYVALERVTNFTYYTFGGQEGYKKNAIKEYGYLLFYTNEKSVITDRILDYTYGHCRTGIKKTSTEYIVVHDTWNTSPTAGALAHANYLNNVNNDPNGDYLSWHFVVDEDYAVQQLPLDEVAYHAGDGSRVYGETYYNDYYKYQSIGGGNRNGIGIESCVNYGTNYTNVMRRLARLVSELLIDYNLGMDRVKQHHDFSGKNCPMTMRENGRWEEFLNMVEIFYYGKTTLKDCTFKWTSLSPDILDDEGHVINHPGKETVVNYQVEVTYNGETRTYKFSSILDALE